MGYGEMDLKSLVIGVLSTVLLVLFIYIGFLQRSIKLQIRENEYSAAYISIISQCLEDNRLALQVILQAQGDQDRALQTVLKYNKKGR